MLPRPSKHSQALGPGVTGDNVHRPEPPVVWERPLNSEQQPSCGAAPFLVDPTALADSRQHTQYPYVTGTSVLAIKYKDGVMIACDTLGAYGSTKRYKSVQRVHRINDRVLVAASGELSDFQHIITLLDELTTEDYCADDGITLGPHEVYAYLQRVMYNRRNKMNPLWNTLVVAGLRHDGTTFCGLVGMIGVHYEDSHVTTGFANQLARPLFREHQSDDMTEEAATTLMHDALRVCYYRDKQSINKFILARVTDKGTSISEPFALDMRWDYKLFARPTQWAIGAW